MNKNLFLSQIKQLIKPAYGCTEIGTVALSVAKASSLIENKIKKINVVISDYIYRNLVNVGVPKLGFCGIDFIVASAAILKNPEDKLNILIKLNSSRKKEAEVLLNKKNITLTHTSNVNPIYCKTEITDLKNNKATVIIEYEHDTFSLVKLNNKVISSYKNKSTDKQTNNMFSKLSLEDIIKNVKSLQLKDLTFLNEGIDMNNEIANYGLKHYSKSNYTKSIKNNNLINKAYEPILITLTAGIEARMNGCELPVMSSCGSGDHGLTISIPLFSFAKKNKIAKLSFYQSLALAHLIT
jgi:L-cysteine desulfidase